MEYNYDTCACAVENCSHVIFKNMADEKRTIYNFTYCVLNQVYMSSFIRK